MLFGVPRIDLLLFALRFSLFTFMKQIYVNWEINDFEWIQFIRRGFFFFSISIGSYQIAHDYEWSLCTVSWLDRFGAFGWCRLLGVWWTACSSRGCNFAWSNWTVQSAFAWFWRQQTSLSRWTTRRSRICSTWRYWCWCRRRNVETINPTISTHLFFLIAPFYYITIIYEFKLLSYKSMIHIDGLCIQQIYLYIYNEAPLLVVFKLTIKSL